MEKEKTISELYSLRAGLSAISMEYDKAQAIDADCESKLDASAKEFCGDLVCYGFGMRNKNHDGLESLQNRYKDYWLACDDCKDYFDELKTSAENAYKQKLYIDDAKLECGKNKVRSIILFSMTFIFAIALALMGAGALGSCVEDTGDLAVFIILIVIDVVIFIVSLIFLRKALSANNRHKENLKKANERIIAAEKLLANLPENIQKTQAIIRKRDDDILPIKQSCNDFYLALKKQFTSILDERDWKNLDLVIFELETRRADTIKEALQLVDRELQTERIQKTIVQATEQICYEIRQGFEELKTTIIECGKVISSQLSGISLQLGGLSGQLHELTDGVNLSNALQTKANVTSAQLLEDVHAIRYYQ